MYSLGRLGSGAGAVIEVYEIGEQVIWADPVALARHIGGRVPPLPRGETALKVRAAGDYSEASNQR